jgi:hypothetical protein
MEIVSKNVQSCSEDYSRVPSNRSQRSECNSWMGVFKEALMINSTSCVQNRAVAYEEMQLESLSSGTF